LSDTLVLCYHAVSERWPAPLSVTPQAFERQLALLRRRGYEGVTFGDAVFGGSAPKTLAVTFDDAYLSVLEVARPILDRLGLPATVFVPTDWPGRGEPMHWPGIDQWMGGEFEHELRPLTWEQLAELHAQGWEIGSHTRSHPHLTTLDDAALAEELRESRAECERRLGHPCTTIAYPYGDYDSRVSTTAGQAGYEAACTLPARIHPARPLEWPRVGVYHDDSERRYRLKVSRAVRAMRSSRAWEVLDSLRRRGGAA
jgi:peptidoglycan/xylan/chitin deacetylase (PgdA/CDA1 family)